MYSSTEAMDAVDAWADAASGSEKMSDGHGNILECHRYGT